MSKKHRVTDQAVRSKTLAKANTDLTTECLRERVSLGKKQLRKNTGDISKQDSRSRINYFRRSRNPTRALTRHRQMFTVVST